MRRIAIVNQKGGVGKTTSAVNLGAALARAGQRVVLFDLDPQGNLSTHLGIEVEAGEPSSYGVLAGACSVAEALCQTRTPGLWVVPTGIDLSGAELELAQAQDREQILARALARWSAESEQRHGVAPAEFVLFDCPPSLGLLSLNALIAASEVFIALQTEFLALQGMTRLLDVIERIREHLNPGLTVSGIIPCLYDNRLRLGREVLSDIRRYFPAQCFRRAISANVKLAEAPSFGQSIFEYAPDSTGARDYAELAEEVLAQGKQRAPEPAVPATSAGPGLLS
jgi:chromosome partitioning protein